MQLEEFGTYWQTAKVPLSKAAKNSDQFEVIISGIINCVIGIYAFLLAYLLTGFEKNTSAFWQVFGDPQNFSVFCFSAFCIFYAWYAAKYFELVWKPFFFSEVDDLGFFRFYNLYVFLCATFGLLFLPLLWPTIIAFVFLPLAWKKRNTMKKFKAANLEYQRRSKKDNGMAKSALAASNLAESFFLNFVVWGLLFCVIGQLLVYLSFSKGGPIIVKIGATDLPLYQIAIGLYMNVILVFFALKIFNGIEGISKKVERGEHESFSLLINPFRG